MSKRGNHGGKAEHRNRKEILKSGEKDFEQPIDLESHRLLRDAGNAIDDMIDMANEAAADGRENVLQEMLDTLTPIVDELEKLKE